MLMKEFTLHVPDISCGHCVAAVRGAVEQIEGIQEVEVSLETKTVLARGIDDLQLSDIVAAVRGAGYTPQVEG
jgi:copper chaperone